MKYEGENLGGIRVSVLCLGHRLEDVEELTIALVLLSETALKLFHLTAHRLDLLQFHLKQHKIYKYSLLNTIKKNVGE